MTATRRVRCVWTHHHPQERLNALERKSEALWHVKEGGEELRVLVERLKTDVESVQGNLTEMQGASRHASHMVEKLDTMNNQTREQMADIVAKMNVLENEDKKVWVGSPVWTVGATALPSPRLPQSLTRCAHHLVCA